MSNAEYYKHVWMWNATKNGHLCMVEMFIKEHDICIITKPSTDGTTPAFIAHVKKHEKILKYFEERIPKSTNFEETETKSIDSHMKRISKSFPVFNEKIEKKFSFPEIFSVLGLRLSNYILNDLCPLKKIKETLNGESRTMFLKDIIVQECSHENKNENCLMVQDLLTTMQEVEKELFKEMSDLKLAFILVGSIAEGTRVGIANELDLTVRFEGLCEKSKALLIGDNAFTLNIPSDTANDHPLLKYCEDKIFIYDLFFAKLLEHLSNIVKKLSYEIEKKTNGRLKPGQQKQLCDECNLEGDFKHCEKCLFPVTFTKIGPCLIFTWGKENTVLTVDLVPVIPIQGQKVTDLFNLCTKTLFKDRPAGWLKYLKGYIKRDRILPESYQDEFDKKVEDFVEVGMKLLNYESEKNFIIRPAQQMNIEQFSSNGKLKEIYARVKALKSYLKIDISSYFIKKIVLSENFKKGFGDAEIRVGVFKLISHPDIRPSFQEHVVYDNHRLGDYSLKLKNGKEADIS